VPDALDRLAAGTLPTGKPDTLDQLALEALNPQAAPQQPRNQPQQPQPKPAEESPAPEGYNAHGGLTEELGAAFRGAADSATFGTLDEASGLLDTAFGGGLTGTHSVWTSGKSFSDTLTANIAQERAVQKADAEYYGKSRIAGQLLGGLLIPFGAGAKGALQVAKVGAVQGAAYGAGSGEDLASRALGAVEGAGIGGAVGGILGKVTEAAAPLVSKLFGKGATKEAEALASEAGVAGEAAPVEEGLTGSVTDTTPEGEGPLAWTAADNSGNRQPILGADEIPASPAHEEIVPLHTEGTPEAPAGEPAGTISRAGLQDLQAQVEHFRSRVQETDGRAVDITTGSPEHPTLGAFRLGNLGDDAEPMSLLGALTRQLDSLPKLSDAEYISQVKAAAGELAGGDHEALDALAKQIAGPMGRPDLAIGVLRTVQRRAAEDVDLFHGAGIDWSTATPEMIQSAGQAIYNVQKVNELVQAAKVGAGRALRVFSLPNSERYFEAMAQQESLGSPIPGERSLPPLPSTPEEMQDFMELWGMGRKGNLNPDDLLSGTLTVPTAGKYLASSFANLFTASILSAPKTVILNVAGPAVINTVRSLEKMGGGALLALNPFSSAAERAAAAEVAKQTPIALFHTLGDIRDAFRYGVQAFQENHTVLGGGGTVQDANISFGPYNENLLKAAGADPDWRYSLGNVLNIFPKAFARVNAGLDEMAKRLTYMSEARVRAQVEAAGKGLVGDDAQAYVAQVLKSSVDEAGTATDEALLRAAERTTLTGQVGAEGTFARKVATGIQTMRHDYPLTRFIFPVFNVPANALGETLRRIPLYDRMPWMVDHAADLAGDNGVVAQAEAHGRALLGASFLMAGYLLNQAGLLTGSGPQMGADAKVWRQTHEPYSIRVGDTWVSYRKLDILGGLLAIPASVSDMSVYHKMDQEGMGNAMLMAVGSLATWFKDQASMRTATQLLELGDNPMQNPAKAIESMFGSIAAGTVPGSALIRTLGVDTTDPYARMRRHWEDYIKAGIPGLSQELEPLRNVLGEPVNRPNNSIGEAVFPVTMAPVATYAREPVLDELTRLYRHTGYGAGADPKSLLFGFADPQDVKLEDGVSLYSHALQARATMRLDGQTLKQALGELFASADYNEARDADSGQAETSLGEPSRAYMVRSLFGRYDKAIKADIASASSIALRYMTAAAAKHRDDAYLNAVPLEDLVRNPDLYRANGVDPQEYADKITDGAAGTLLEALSGGGRR